MITHVLMVLDIKRLHFYPLHYVASSALSSIFPPMRLLVELPKPLRSYFVRLRVSAKC